MADHQHISPFTAYLHAKTEMDKLPLNEWITLRYCNRWSGILVMDGKYVAIKGYEQKIPFIYGIDYLTHDIPAGLLAPSENYDSFLKYFRTLKEIGYNLQIVVCDDRGGLKEALLAVFPNARLQLCQNHYLENIRQALGIRTQEQYQDFFSALHQAFNVTVSYQDREVLLRDIYYRYGRQDEGVARILIEIMRRKNDLFATDEYIDLKAPSTTNIIEAYNSHIQGRLKSVKGFQSFHSAKRWFNAWMLRRRTKRLTDCRKPFKHLNGKMSLQMSIKKEEKIEDALREIYGEKTPEIKR